MYNFILIIIFAIIMLKASFIASKLTTTVIEINIVIIVNYH